MTSAAASAISCSSGDPGIRSLAPHLAGGRWLSKRDIDQDDAAFNSGPFDDFDAAAPGAQALGVDRVEAALDQNLRPELALVDGPVRLRVVS